MSSPILLDHRAVLIVRGAAAEEFLNGLVTVSTLNMTMGEARYGALLTPQGKIIADMILSRAEEGFFIDCDAGIATLLVKRLTMFKLRAAVAIEQRFDLGVAAFMGAPDPRSPDAPARSIIARASAPQGGLGDYHAARIAAGLAEQGIDFRSEEVFPADIDMDLFNGVDFRKGCFVGQEVVSRMKRRGTARRRTLKAIVTQGASAPSAILAGDFEIGTLTSVSDIHALARVRIDRVAEANAKGEPITANGRPVVLDHPPWLGDELAAIAETKEAKT